MEDNYKVIERAEKAIKQHGTVDKAISFLKQELEEFESLWSKYSSDCLGHGITCNRLIIEHLSK